MTRTIQPPRMLTEHEFTRVEFEWLAVDADDHVLLFWSAGRGPVPEPSIEDADALEHVVEDVRKRLPIIGEAAAGARIYTPSDWVDAAARGLFAYDWSYDRKRYELVARPTRPQLIDGLADSTLRDLARRVRLRVHATLVSALAPEQLAIREG